MVVIYICLAGLCALFDWLKMTACTEADFLRLRKERSRLLKYSLEWLKITKEYKTSNK